MTSVLVVDDSQFMRTVIGNVLSEEGYEVLTASDGERALEAVEQHDPDIVTMDVEMPGMSGIEAVDRIMKRNPTRILMLSAHTKSGADETFEALSRGAIDFLPKPGGDFSGDIPTLQRQLKSKVSAVENADLTSVAVERVNSTVQSTTAATNAGTASVDGPAGSRKRTSQSTSEPIDTAGSQYVETPTVIIGASTGGPRFVEQTLAELPAIDARVLVVQHMPPSFTDRMARRLDTISEFDVREAADGARVGDGEALVAKGGYHMEVAGTEDGKLKVELTETERRHGVRPAIDETMETAAATLSTPVVGVALTGMGKDGAAGISAIKSVGGATIAQDQGTSPVFGIPRAAIETGDVDRVCPGDQIAAGILGELETDGDMDG